MPVENMDPDYVLEMFRFHMDVFRHDPEECDNCFSESCDYSSWDYHDTYHLFVHFGGALDEWMSGGGRPPREWSPRRLRRGRSRPRQ